LWDTETWQRLDSSATIPQDIVGIIQDGLQHRVIQELELLAERIRCLPRTNRETEEMGGVDGNGVDEVIVNQFQSIEDFINSKKIPNADNTSAIPSGIQAVLDISGLQSSQHLPLESEFPLRDGISFVASPENGRTIPLYNLFKSLPRSTHPDILQHLTSIIRSENRYLLSLNHPPPDPVQSPTISPILSISSVSHISSSRTPADPVPLLIALWRLALWSSPQGKAWTLGPDGARGVVGDGEEVVQGFKEVQGVMHTKW
jgi:hypothetical protein